MDDWISILMKQANEYKLKIRNTEGNSTYLITKQGCDTKGETDKMNKILKFVCDIILLFYSVKYYSCSDTLNFSV